MYRFVGAIDHVNHFDPILESTPPYTGRRRSNSIPGQQFWTAGSRRHWVPIRRSVPFDFGTRQSRTGSMCQRLWRLGPRLRVSRATHKGPVSERPERCANTPRLVSQACRPGCDLLALQRDRALLPDTESGESLQRDRGSIKIRTVHRSGCIRGAAQAVCYRCHVQKVALLPTRVLLRFLAHPRMSG